MHVIFDLDGTLADTLPGIAEAFDLAVRKVVPDIKFTSFNHHIGPPIRKFSKSIIL